MQSKILAEVLNARINSNAVAESNPLVELSQHWILAPLSETSAMETRFRSPPETPLTISLPTFVFLVWEIPYVAI